jgi:hypothetical protein
VYAAENSVMSELGSPLPQSSPLLQSSPLKPCPQGSFGSDTNSIIGFEEQLGDAEGGQTDVYDEAFQGAPQDQPFAEGEEVSNFPPPMLTIVKRSERQAQAGFSESSPTALIISEAQKDDKHKVAGSILCWVPADAHGPNPQSQHKVIFAQTDGKKDAGIAITRANACRSFASCKGCNRKNCHFFHYAPGDVVDDFVGRNPKLMRRLEDGVRHDIKHGSLFTWNTGDLAQLKEQNLQYATEVRQQKITEMRAARRIEAQTQMAYAIINAPIGEDELAEEDDKAPPTSKKRKKKRKDAKKSNKKKKKKPLEEQPQAELTREQLLAQIAELQARADGSQ